MPEYHQAHQGAGPQAGALVICTQWLPASANVHRRYQDATQAIGIDIVKPKRSWTSFPAPISGNKVEQYDKAPVAATRPHRGSIDETTLHPQT